MASASTTGCLPDGLYTALVTPFVSDGNGIDFGALAALVEAQIASGVDGLVPCGTTGESATMSAVEREKVIAAVVKAVDGRVPVVAGTGSNGTASTIDHQRRAQGAGADFSLVVTPYYNKPSPQGLIRHYQAIAEATDLKVVLYNVPGRTACDLKPQLVGELAKIPGVVGIKEATGELDRVAQIREVTPEGFGVFSGDDGTSCALNLFGGNGVISVTSNLLPKEMVKLTHLALHRDVDSARALHERLRPVFSALFVESNPVPVKTALAMRGMMSEVFRAPLYSLTDESRAVLVAALDGFE